MLALIDDSSPHRLPAPLDLAETGAAHVGRVVRLSGEGDVTWTADVVRSEVWMAGSLPRDLIEYGRLVVKSAQCRLNVEYGR